MELMEMPKSCTDHSAEGGYPEYKQKQREGSAPPVTNGECALGD